MRRYITYVFLLIIALNSVSIQHAQSQRDFSREVARKAPSWLRDGVIYEVFPRAFSQEGTFDGVTAKLDQLKELGVNIIWLMPIHPVGKDRRKGSLGSPYAVVDYYGINPDYGTKEDLKELIAEAHKRDMKVIIDIVANHTAWDSVLMKTPEFYTRDQGGKIIPPVDEWTDVADLNYDNPKVRDYMIDMLKFWVRDYDLDGFRCDVAGMVPTDFWEKAREELDKVKPDIMMLAEAEQPDLLVKAFDTDYSWRLLHGLNEVIAGGAPAVLLWDRLDEEKRRFPQGALRMRFSDNHDEIRAIARLGQRGALAASALMFTIDGVPLLYNGQEIGDTSESGAPALFEKHLIVWQFRERRPEFLEFYKNIIKLRKTHSALRNGETIKIQNSDENRVITFVRKDKTEELLVAINFSNRPFIGFVETANSAEFADVTPGVASVARASTLPSLSLGSYGFKIFRRELSPSTR
ncbi:MAG: family 10 glycosylhydrolase [Blastocatellia bacterium]|nr:family 10 glycosylhydrolase [Blastocatellia bacterium]